MMRGRGGRLHAQASVYFEPATERPPVKRGEWYWARLPATGLWFVIFGLVTFVLGVLVLPLIRLLSVNRARGQRMARAVVAAGLRFFVTSVRFLRLIRFEFEGHERLGRPGQLVIANHPTLIDVAFLLGFMPTAGCVVKRGLFSNLITRGAVRATGYIANTPTEEMIHGAEAALQAGETLLMFPEGTRTVPGRPVSMQRGAANVALRAARVLTPVFIECNPPTLSKNQPWYRIPPCRPHFRLRVGDDIGLDVYRGVPLPLASRKLNTDLAGLFAGATTVRD